MGILNNAFIKKYLASISVFVLIGFFACVLHVEIPSDLGHTENGSHHEAPVNDIACIDNLTYSRTSINILTDVTEVIFSNSLNQVSEFISLSADSHQFFPTTKPPNDGIALYVKNNMYRI